MVIIGKLSYSKSIVLNSILMLYIPTKYLDYSKCKEAIEQRRTDEHCFCFIYEQI